MNKRDAQNILDSIYEEFPELVPEPISKKRMVQISLRLPINIIEQAKKMNPTNYTKVLRTAIETGMEQWEVGGNGTGKPSNVTS